MSKFNTEVDDKRRKIDDDDFDQVRYNNRHIPFQGHSLMYMYSQYKKQQGCYISKLTSFLVTSVTLQVISVFKYNCVLPCLVIFNKNGLGMFVQNNKYSNFVIEKTGILEAVPFQHLYFQGQEESVKKPKKKIHNLYTLPYCFERVLSRNDFSFYMGYVL